MNLEDAFNDLEESYNDETPNVLSPLDAFGYSDWNIKHTQTKKDGTKLLRPDAADLEDQQQEVKLLLRLTETTA